MRTWIGPQIPSSQGLFIWTRTKDIPLTWRAIITIERNAHYITFFKYEKLCFTFDQLIRMLSSNHFQHIKYTNGITSRQGNKRLYWNDSRDYVISEKSIKLEEVLKKMIFFKWSGTFNMLHQDTSFYTWKYKLAGEKKIVKGQAIFPALFQISVKKH